ncbi:MAG: phosphatidate cytidylyltransferase [Alphaproteobacteria bacterium]|nr:phosphatidate cytidylyltransferase [Alphaproteobacteria bacterium]
MTMPGDAEPPAGQAAPRSELALRVATAAIAAPIVLLATWAGGIWFAILIALAIGIGGHEWSRICNIDRPSSVALLAMVGPVMAIAIVTGGATAGLLVLALMAVSAFGGGSAVARMWSAAGVIYLGIATVAILVLRSDPQSGLEALIFLFGVVWLTDIGAYAFGRLIGGPRLAPSISPGKTWAGAIGGFALAVAGAQAGALLFALDPPMGAIAMAIFLSIATQCGDLLESWVKRRFDKKDSGTIIPGHGGILDRIDGLLIAAPVMAAISIF